MIAKLTISHGVALPAVKPTQPKETVIASSSVIRTELSPEAARRILGDQRTGVQVLPRNGLFVRGA